MRTNRPSSTSNLVAFVRSVATEGITSVPDFHDPVAERLLPQPWSLAAGVLGRAARGHPHVQRALWVLSRGMVDLVPVRTRVIDTAWEAAYRRGIRQLVILGAGLDGRAWRLASTPEAVVFEVDHPATQQYKRQRVAHLAPVVREVRFVTVDFQRDDLLERLRAEGHRDDAQAFFIWEGVTPYLLPAAQRETLQKIAELSPPGSELVVTYTQGGGRRGRMAALRRYVGLVGEPFVGLIGREEMGQMLQQTGFTILEDHSIQEWAERHRARRMEPDAYTMRIAHVRRRGAEDAVTAR